MNKTFLELSYFAVQQQKNIDWLLKENARSQEEIKHLNDALKGAQVIVDIAKEQIDVTQERNDRLEKEIERLKTIEQAYNALTKAM